MSEPIAEPHKDHRRMKRKSAKKSISVSCRKGMMGLGPNLAIRLADVSVDGAQIIVKTRLANGEVVEVSFSAPGLPPTLSREGTVAWCSDTDPSGFHIGVRFRSPLAYEHVFHMT